MYLTEQQYFEWSECGYCIVKNLIDNKLIKK